MFEPVNIVSLIGVVGVLAIIVYLIRSGHPPEELEAAGIKAKFRKPARTSHEIVLVAAVPERMGLLELSLSFNGRHVTNINAKDIAGRYTSQDVSVRKDGSRQYAIEATGVQRVYNAQGQLDTRDYRSSGDGQVNIVHGGTYMLWEVMELGPGGARSVWMMDSRENYVNSQLPDDMAIIEIDKLIDAA